VLVSFNCLVFSNGNMSTGRNFFSFSYILGLFNDAFNHYDYIASNNRIISEQRVVKDMEASGRVLT
jgi:hypothetical protein